MIENTASAAHRQSPRSRATGEPASDTRTPFVFVTLQAHDAHGLIDFLTKAFGFIQTARYMDQDRIAHAELRWPHGPGGVMLGPYRPDNSCSRPPGGASTYIVTEDVAAVHQLALDHGATILRAPADTSYGSREFTAVDPEGNLWTFGTYAGEPLPA